MNKEFPEKFERKPVGFRGVDRVTSASFKTVARLLESQEVVADFGLLVLVKLCYEVQETFTTNYLLASQIQNATLM